MIGGTTEKGQLGIRACQIGCSARNRWNCCVRLGRCWLHSRIVALAHIGRGEQMTGAGGLLLLRKMLSLRRCSVRHPHARCRGACIHDRPAEVTGQRWAQPWNGVRQVRIIARQTGKAFGHCSIVGVVKFRTRRLGMRPQRDEERASDTGARHQPQAQQHFARNTHYRRTCGPQAHFAGMRAIRVLITVAGRIVAHDCGLPSLRTMRTICCGSAPS